MALSHAGYNFYGTIGHIQLGQWQFDAKRSKFFGVIGVSEILGGLGSRSIVAPYWIYNSFESSSQIVAAMHDLDYQCGLYGTLQETGTIEREFQKTTFEGFTLERGPFFTTHKGWIAIGKLNFLQLAPNGT